MHDVCILVSSHIGRVAECFAAVPTLEGFLARVDPFMHNGLLPTEKSFITIITLVRLFPCVCALVALNMIRSSKPKSTISTLERTLPSMNQFVIFHGNFGGKRLFTVTTLEFFPFNMDFFMDKKANFTRKLFSTISALQWSIACVIVLMFHQVALDCK